MSNKDELRASLEEELGYIKDDIEEYINEAKELEAFNPTDEEEIKEKEVQVAFNQRQHEAAQKAKDHIEKRLATL